MCANVNRGGKLVLLEITNAHQMRVGLWTGLLKQWWEAEKLPPNKWSPCIDESSWDKVLRHCGFSGVDFVSPDWDDSECQEASLLISTAKANATDDVPMPDVVIVARESTDQMEVAETLLSESTAHKNTGSYICSLSQAASRSDLQSVFCIFLVEIESPLLSRITANEFAQLRTILTTTRGVIWVTQQKDQAVLKPDLNMVNGLARALRSENPEMKFVTVALKQCSKVRRTRIIYDVLERAIKTRVEDLEPEFEDRDGILHINRVTESCQMNRKLAEDIAPHRYASMELEQHGPLQLSVGSLGLIESLEYRADHANIGSLAADEVLISVKAVGATFRDYLILSGQHNEIDYGTEASGIIKRAGPSTVFQPGDRVCFSVVTSFRTHIRCKALNVSRIPDWMDLEAAASLPTASLLSYYALVKVANLSSGETVLIHNGASCVGQMAIQLAQKLGAQVYTTTGTLEKKRMLEESLDVPSDHIFPTQGMAFARAVRRRTAGIGIDVVLNTQHGENFETSLDCVASFGRFIDIGLRSASSWASSKSLTSRNHNVTFSSINMADIIRSKPQIIHSLFTDVMQMFEQLELRLPSPLSLFPASGIRQAFESLHDAVHVGKNVVTFRPQDSVSVSVNYPVWLSSVANVPVGCLGREANLFLRPILNLCYCRRFRRHWKSYSKMDG